MDPWSYSGFRLFYGAPSQMTERPILSYEQGAGVGEGPEVSFSVGSTTFTLSLSVILGPDAGPFGSPDPDTLDTGSGGMLPVTLRLPTPSSLSGFTFICSSVAGGE